MSPQRKTLAAVFVLALVIRLAAIAVLLPQMKPDWDQDDYRALARSLAAGKGFVALDHNSGRELPNVVRTPVYPLVLAGSLLGRIKPRLAVIFLAGFFPLLGVWAVRNEALTGHWFVSTIAIHNLRLYRAAGVTTVRRTE